MRVFANMPLIAKAIHNHLSTNIGVMSVLGDPVRLYDSAPEDPQFPYLTYGDVQSEAEGGDDVNLVLHKMSLHIWSRYAGRAEVFDILNVIARALDAAPLLLEDGQTVVSALPYMDVVRAADGRTLHGLLRVHVYSTFGAGDE